MKNSTVHKSETSVGTLAYYDIGKGQPIVLLHGFPDNPLTFTHLVKVLNQEGFRCIVPYMPGYGDSSLPHKKEGIFKSAEASMLGIGKMIDEFLRNILPDERIHIIGHDWGSLVAQVIVALNDENPQVAYQIDRSVFYAVPPIAYFFKNTSFKQIIRSRYMYYFQGFGVAQTIRKQNLAYIKELWQRWSPWTPEELEQQVQLKETLNTLSEEGCLENGMAYYRFLLNPFYTIRGSSIIQQNMLLFKKRSRPCLLLTGEKDECIGAEMFNGSEALYPHEDTRLIVLKNLGHFAHLEDPDTVNAIITDFIQVRGQQKLDSPASA